MSGLGYPVMIFAAGFGTRMGALTRHRPKPLIPVAGQPLIDRAIGTAREAGAGTIVANTHYLAEQLESHLAGSGVRTRRETPDILDTGGGLKAALPLLGPDAAAVVTLNPDVIWRGPNPVAFAARRFDPGRMDALLVCVPLAAARGRTGDGDFSCDAAGRLTRGGSLVYGGVQIIAADVVRDMPGAAFSLNAVWDAIAGRKRLFGALHPGPWCDVGHPEGIEIAETLLLEPDV